MSISPLSSVSTDLTVAEVATLWQCAEETVRRAVRRGDLPSYRLPGTKLIRIRHADAVAYRGGDEPADLTAMNIAAYITKTLAEAPPLSDSQRSALAELLRPAREHLRGASA